MAALPRLLRAQTVQTVADTERARILARAAVDLDAAVTPLHGVGDHPASPLHRDLATAMAGVDAVPENAPLRHFSAMVAALTAAYTLTHEERYAARSLEHIKASLFARDFSAPASGPDRTFEFLTLSSPEAVLGLVPLAEFARATSFLADAETMTAELQATLKKNFTAILHGLTTTPLALLARDAKDHRGSAWLLIVSALARATGDSNQLDFCRVWITKPTLRNQLTADGRFPQEVASENPYRNSLMNFDLLAGCAQLLTTPFSTPWTDELPDGPGLRAAAAYLYPFVKERIHWPFPTDAAHFRDLPGKRAGMLFAAHAFHRPEYIAAYADAPDCTAEELAYSFPVTEPLLWTARAPHGM